MKKNLFENWYFWPFWFPLLSFFFLTKNGNQKGHEYHKGLKIANFSYLMRSKVTLPRFAEVNFNSLKSIGHMGSPRNRRFANRWRARLILKKSSFYLMKSAENSWVCSASMNATVHWAYRGQVLSLIFNLQYHTKPGKIFFENRSTCTFWTFLAWIRLCAPAALTWWHRWLVS